MGQVSGEEKHDNGMEAACGGGVAGSGAGVERAGGRRRHDAAILLSGRGRRPNHQDRRRHGRGFREGPSRHQGDANLCRHLPGHHRQSADRDEGGRRAPGRGNAVGGSLHPDRRGRDHAHRRPCQDACRQGVDERLLSRLHGEQPHRRQDLGDSLPALDRGDVLEQGGLQGARSRSRSRAGHLGRARRLRQEAHQARRRRQSHPTRSCDSVVLLSLLALPGTTTENDVRLMNEAGTETDFDKPAVIEALQYWVDLSRKYKIQPPGIIEWGATPRDFFERKTAIMWTTTGNLTNVRKNAKFPFGVAMLPAKKRRGSPTGGGNFYIFKKSSPAQQQAALTFVEWMTSPERAAQWGIDTGYVAVSPAAWETPAMKAYVKDFPPAAVARDQLQYAVAELSTHDNQRVTKALNDGLQAALTGAKTPAQAMKDAQAEATRLLRPYK